MVWGARNSVSLLHETSASWYPGMTLSSDGRFPACSTTGPGTHLWKESPTGYTLIGKLPSNARRSIPLLSPNGESIITFGGPTIQLWHTKAFTTPSSILAHIPHFAEDFILEFVPDRKLAVVARPEEKTVTVLDLESGLPQLIIDASMEVYGFRVVEKTVVVIGDGRIITWNLPEGNSLPLTRVGVESSIRITYFRNEPQDDATTVPASLDLHHIAFLRRDPRYLERQTLHVYCSLTGRLIHALRDTQVRSLWFPLGKNGIWYATDDHVVRNRVIGSQSGPKWKVSMTNIEYLLSQCPWRSSRGYEVMYDSGWLIGPDGKQLFMLPPPWRSYATQRVWDGQFLALLHGSLPQPVILDLAP